MKFIEISNQLIELRNQDEELRTQLLREGVLSEGYNDELRILHERNAKKLEVIIDAIGYPTTDKIGADASEAAWIIIQHAISLPSFMKKCHHLLLDAVQNDHGNAIHLAYLTDRIAVFEGKLQSYGTQFDWDDNGELSPHPYDDTERVNCRRKLLGLNTLQEQTSSIRIRAQNENDRAPSNREKKQQAFDRWRIQVGWIDSIS